MTLNQQQNDKLIRQLDDIQPVIEDLKDALAAWQGVTGDEHATETRLDRVGDKHLTKLWTELVTRYYDIMLIDKPNKFDTWDANAPKAFALSDFLVARAHPKQVWLRDIEDAVYDKLPEAIAELEGILDTYQPALLSLKTQYYVGKIT